MSDLDWSTPDGLVAIRDHLAARIDGWRQPVAYAVGAQPGVVVAGVALRPRQRARRPARPARRRARHGARARRVDGHRAPLAQPARGCRGVAGAGRGLHLARPPEPRRLARGAARARGQPGSGGAGGVRGRSRRPGHLGGRRLDAGDSSRVTPRCSDRARVATRVGRGPASRDDRGPRVGPPDGASTDLDRPTAPRPPPEAPVLDTLTSLLEAGRRRPVGARGRAAHRGGRRPRPARSPARASSSPSPPSPWPVTARTCSLLALAAGVGAFLGDSLTYVVGRRYGPQRLARVTRPRPASRPRAGVRHPRAPRRARRPHRALRAARPGRRQPHRGGHRLPAPALPRPRRARCGDLGRVVGRRRRPRRSLARTATRCSGRPRASPLALGLGLAVDRVARRVTGWGGVSRRARQPTSATRTGAVVGPVAGPVAAPARRRSALTTPSRGCPRGASSFALSTRECQ